MIDTWLYTLASVFAVSMVSLVGIFTIYMNEQRLKSAIFFLVSFSVGALIGSAFIHLLPEIVDEYGFGFDVSLYLISGILFFFIMEKFIQWRHCHIPTSRSHPHPIVYMNIVGDGLHNFMDGMVIAASYISSIPLGIATTFAVLFHEIPQEIGDFGVLLHGGFNKAKALFYNFMSALAAMIGAIAVLMIGAKTQDITIFLLPFTAGGFIYIAGSDLIPELHKESHPERSVVQLIGIIMGVLVMLAFVAFE